MPARGWGRGYVEVSMLSLHYHEGQHPPGLRWVSVECTTIGEPSYGYSHPGILYPENIRKTVACNLV